MPDPISLQVFLWLSATVLITLLICGSIVAYRTAEAWGERSRADASVQNARTKEAEANARQAEMVYEKALLDRVGTPPPITLALSQATIDKLALDYVKKRIESMKVKVET